MKKFFIIILFILSSCTKKEEITIYYEDGGTVKARYTLNDKKKNGFETLFFPDGSIKGKVNWVDGKMDGEMIEYHTNGTIFIKRNFRNGIPIGKVEMFDPNDNLIEIHYFDSLGRFYDFRKYTKEGKVQSVMYPLPWLSKDTVLVGDTIDFALSLGNIQDSRLNSGTVIICSDFIYDDNNDPSGPKDTLYIIHSDQNNYLTKIIAKQKGQNILQGVLICKEGKSVGDRVFDVFFEKPYFVRDQ